jgi:hypothetical protein
VSTAPRCRVHELHVHDDLDNLNHGNASDDALRYLFASGYGLAAADHLISDDALRYLFASGYGLAAADHLISESSL